MPKATKPMYVMGGKSSWNARLTIYGLSVSFVPLVIHQRLRSAYFFHYQIPLGVWVQCHVLLPFFNQSRFAVPDDSS